MTNMPVNPDRIAHPQGGEHSCLIENNKLKESDQWCDLCVYLYIHKQNTWAGVINHPCLYLSSIGDAITSCLAFSYGSSYAMHAQHVEIYEEYISGT